MDQDQPPACLLCAPHAALLPSGPPVAGTVGVRRGPCQGARTHHAICGIAHELLVCDRALCVRVYDGIVLCMRLRVLYPTCAREFVGVCLGPAMVLIYVGQSVTHMRVLEHDVCRGICVGDMCDGAWYTNGNAPAFACSTSYMGMRVVGLPAVARTHVYMRGT